MDEAHWRTFHDLGTARGRQPTRELQAWLKRTHIYGQRGVAFDIEENEPQVRCVAAPICDAGGRIVAAFSVSSTLQYMDVARMELLATKVLDVARDISRKLEWAR